MKYSIFLFLQLFMLTTSKQVWILQKGQWITSDPKTRIDHKEAYIFYTTEFNCASIIYVAGAQSKPYQNVLAGVNAVKILREIYKSVLRGPPNIFFHRITSDSTINSFADVQNWERVFENIPRLYVVTISAIYQIPLNPEIVDSQNAFLLYYGSRVIVYYSLSLNKRIRNLAKSFAGYIARFEKMKHNVDTSISELTDKKNSNNVLKDFVSKIKEMVEIHRKSKTNSLQKNDAGNSETINEDFAKLSITYDEADKKFEELKKSIYERYGGITSPTWAENEDFERILSSTTATASSTSTSSASASTASSSTGRKNKDKQRTKRKGKKNNPPTTSEPLFMSKSSIVIYGHRECYLQQETVLSYCVYVILDTINLESFVYFGKEAGQVIDYYDTAIKVAEIFLDRYPSGNVSYIVEDGNLLPPSFIMRFENELKKNLN